MDRARVLTPAQLVALEERLQNFERNTGRVVVVHTTPSLEGLAINEYSSRVAERWRMRRAELEAGAILTFAPNERKLNIEVGPRLQSALSDPEIYAYVQKRILDEFRRQDVARGIEVGVDAILVAVARTGRPAPVAATLPSGVVQGIAAAWPDAFLLGLLLLALLAVSWIVLGASRREQHRRRRRSERAGPRSSGSRRPADSEGWRPVDAADSAGWSYFADDHADRGRDGGGSASD